MGDSARALAVYDAMLPAERTTSTLALLIDHAPAEARSRLLADVLSAADAPGALGPLYRSLLEDPAQTLEEDGARLVAADRTKPSMVNAATAVLKHTEKYDIGDGGLLHYVLYDLRRVSGTTDVEQGAQAAGALIEGRDARRTLRRRIHKTDGRVLEPDRASNASQGTRISRSCRRGTTSNRSSKAGLYPEPPASWWWTPPTFSRSERASGRRRSRSAALETSRSPPGRMPSSANRASGSTASSG